MREIEVKAKVRDRDSLLAKAKSLGINFSDVTTQDDTTYESTTPYDDPDWNIFRIRKELDKTILTMKYKASSRSRDNHEHETAIEDAEEISKMLERLGYTYGVQIIKHRQTATYQDDLEICLDEIDQLGTFIEIEKLTTKEADVDLIQKRLWEVLEQLGVQPDDRIHKGYDTLMHEYVKALSTVRLES